MLRWSHLKPPAVFLALVLLALYGLQLLVRDREFNTQVKIALEALSDSEIHFPRLEGTVEVVGTRLRIDTQELVALLPRNRDLSTIFMYDLDGVPNATGTAMSVDGRHYVFNAYLEGYMPFEVDNPWVPWYVIAQRKQYMFDHLQYPGRRDVWQTSKQALKATRGDCEDHAIILADWLIGLGHDAWVAAGTMRGEGHAWVVLFDEDGTEYLLEATRKRGLRGLNQLPLAKRHTDYQPILRFNNDEFWYNTGSKYTTAYRSSHWRKQSVFHR